MGRFEARKAAESIQRDDHGPALARAVGAVFRAEVRHLGMISRSGQELAANRDQPIWSAAASDGVLGRRRDTIEVVENGGAHRAGSSRSATTGWRSARRTAPR